MRQCRIVAHHVGARGFSVALNVPKKFQNDVINVLYEADAACANQMIAANLDPLVKVLPYCLGSADEAGVLHITRNPFFSSLLKPDEKFLATSCEVELSGEIEGIPVWGVRYDALYRNEMAVTQTLPVQVRSLDSLFASGELSADLLPDFISLDTQGSELDVLYGSRSAIKKSVLAMATEMEFLPMYTGQKLFSDILQFADQNGFQFAGFTYLQDILGARLPVGLRSKGFLAFGDCVFFRRIEALREAFPIDIEYFAASLRLAFLALSFGYFSFAIEALRAGFSINISEDVKHKMRECSYVRFLERLHECASEMPEKFLYDDRYEFVADRRELLASKELELQDAARSALRAADLANVTREDISWTRVKNIILSISRGERPVPSERGKAASAANSAAASARQALEASYAIIGNHGGALVEHLTATTREAEEAATLAKNHRLPASIEERFSRAADRIKAFIRSVPRLHRISKALLAAYSAFRTEIGVQTALQRDTAARSPVERLLIEYGFEQLAADLQQRRQAGMLYVHR